MIQKKLRGGLHYGSSELENDSISAPRRLPETAKGPLKKGRRIVSQPSFFSEICHLAGCSFWGISVPEVHHHPRNPHEWTLKFRHENMVSIRETNWVNQNLRWCGCGLMSKGVPLQWILMWGFWCLIKKQGIFHWKNDDHVAPVTCPPVTDFCWNGMSVLIILICSCVVHLFPKLFHHNHLTFIPLDSSWLFWLTKTSLVFRGNLSIQSRK